ncbi:MAG: hypothetical protein FWE09_06560 [Treponema sp.]|nr:hypothetical protein [Treponema sp.]
MRKKTGEKSAAGVGALAGAVLALAFAGIGAAGIAGAQERPPGPYDEQIGYVGMTLADLIARFGAPTEARAARGAEEWQDDVVFVYPQGDFYLHRDRVWQVGLGSVHGMRVGDQSAVAHLVLGEGAQNYGDFLVYRLQPLAGSGWPVSLRVNFSAGRIAAIFIYRPDF